MNRTPLICHFYALGTIFFWAIGFTFTRIALLSFSPLSLGVLRYIVASAALLTVCLLRREALPARRDLPLFLLGGLCGFAAYSYFFNYGASFLPSAISSLLIATTPVWTTLLARLLYRERLLAVRWAAVAVEFGGVLLLCLLRSNLSSAKGTGAVLVSAVAMAFYNLIQRTLTKRYSAVAASAYSIFAGTLFLLPFLPGALPELAAAPTSHIASLLFLALFPSAFAFILWSKGIALAARTSDVTNYMFLSPLIATLTDLVILREAPDLAALLGGAVILLGLALFNFVGARSADAGNALPAAASDSEAPAQKEE